MEDIIALELEDDADFMFSVAFQNDNCLLMAAALVAARVLGVKMIAATHISSDITSAADAIFTEPRPLQRGFAAIRLLHAVLRAARR